MTPEKKTALGLGLFTVGFIGTLLVMYLIGQNSSALEYSFTGAFITTPDGYIERYHAVSAALLWGIFVLLCFYLALVLCYIFLAKPRGRTGIFTSGKAILLYGVIGTILLLIVSGGYPKIDYYSGVISNDVIPNARVAQFQWSLIGIPTVWFALILWHFWPSWKHTVAIERRQKSQQDVLRRPARAIKQSIKSNIAARKIEYIALPRLDEIHFVSASSSLFKVDMPDVTRSYADRLLSRELEKYADNGWILDEFEFKPWEPVFEPVERWRLLIPFMQPRFKCIGVKAHLRRK